MFVFAYLIQNERSEEAAGRSRRDLRVAYAVQGAGAPHTQVEVEGAEGDEVLQRESHHWPVPKVIGGRASCFNVAWFSVGRVRKVFCLLWLFGWFGSGIGPGRRPSFVVVCAIQKSTPKAKNWGYVGAVLEGEEREVSRTGGLPVR